MGLKLNLSSSLDSIPLIRKFAVTFFLVSILPCAVLLYILQSYFENTAINEYGLLIVLVSMAAGTVAGFFSMRRSLLKIQKVTLDATQVLSKNIPSLKKLAGEGSEVTQLVKTFNEVTQNLEGTIQRLKASKKTMQYVLSKLAVGISSLQTIDTFLELIVEITTNSLDANIGILMLFDEEKQDLYVKCASGYEEGFKGLRLKLGEEAPGWVAKHRKPLLVPKLSSEEKTKKDPFMPPLLAAPMMYKDRLIGVLVVSEKISSDNFEEDELIIVSNLASQTAIAVENDRLHLDAERTYIDTISALAMAVEARDYYSRGHSDRVAQYSSQIAEKLGLDPESIKDIKVAGQLHDVGKIGISDDILKKTDKLARDEWDLMRKHPVIGEGIVKPVHSLSRISTIIRQHHEWLDGTGYPDGLKADQITQEAKILAVADSYDAMITDRPYRKALSTEAAKEELKKYIDIRYDKSIVEAFLNTV